MTTKTPSGGTRSRRAQRLLAMYPDDAYVPVTIQLLADYAALNPKLDKDNYGDGIHGKRLYKGDLRRLAVAGHNVMKALHSAYYAGVTDKEVITACRYAFSGRLSIKRTRKHHCCSAACFSEWTEEVKLSPHTPMLSGEETPRCPKCGSRAGMSEPITYRVSYTAGQSWSHEYRRAVAAVIEAAVDAAITRKEV